jgi:uncharacterized protein (DUF433 family)
MTIKPLTETEKMKKVPGIVFADGPVGRRARVAGSGIDVFEVINIHRTCGEDPAATAEALDSLTQQQLQAAFAYYAAFPEEVDERLARDAEITPEYLRARFPQPQPLHRRTGTR